MYPTLSALKNLYPHVGVNVVSEFDGFVVGYGKYNGRVIPAVTFKGESIEDMESKVFRLYHWEKTNKRLPLPFDISNAERMESKEDGRGKHFAGKMWVMHIDTREKRRVDPHELDWHLTNGYIKAGPRSK